MFGPHPVSTSPFSDIGSDGEFDQNFKLSVSKTVDNHKLRNDFVHSKSARKVENKFPAWRRPDAQLVAEKVGI